MASSTRPSLQATHVPTRLHPARAHRAAIGPALPPLPRPGADRAELGAVQRRLLAGGILALHLAGVWGLLQIGTVREAVVQAAPIFVSWLSPPAPPRPETWPKAPQPAPLTNAPVRPRPPAKLIAAAPSPAPASFAVPAEPQPPEPPSPEARPSPSTAAADSEAAPAPAPRTLPDSAVQFLEAPVVVYPRLSQRRHETGLVVVRAYVGTEGGMPRSVQVERPSGHARLDEAALAAVQMARFKPYAEKGQPVEGWALIPIRFELER
jgi:protein TonB